jgi:hypothetical protein
MIGMFSDYNLDTIGCQVARFLKIDVFKGIFLMNETQQFSVFLPDSMIFRE